jgi:methionyl-tRNA synthetase
MYVWFDALGNYITALGYADDAPAFRRYWLDNPHRVHVIGKGITRFHAVYWPAMLLAAGVPLPTTIFVHGYVTVGGEKISKSLGNVIDPAALVARYGVDPLRYFLLGHIRSTEDGDFTEERFVREANADLANQVGNLLNRTVNMIGRYENGVVPAPGPEEPDDRDLVDAGRALAARVEGAMARFETHEAVAAVWNLVDLANKYVVTMEPWSLAKARAAEGPEGDAAGERLRTCLYNLTEALRLTGVLASPFIPNSSLQLLEQLGVEAYGEWPACAAWGGMVPGTSVAAGEVLFPRIETDG